MASVGGLTINNPLAGGTTGQPALQTGITTGGAAGVNPFNVIKTQYANLTGQKVPGLNVNGVTPQVLSANTSAATTAPATTDQARIDPYAKYGGASGYSSLISGYDTQHNNLLGSYDDTINSAGNSLNGNIIDFVDALTSKQRGVDNSRTQNELSRTQASKDILDSVGNGIRSSGVVLANRNAGSSSAAGQLAAAQAALGRKSMSQVGNQYEANNMNIDTQQSDVNTFRDSNTRKLGDDKTTVINSIVSDAQQKLSSLDAQIASADLPNRINIEAEKEGIRQKALQALQQYDTQLAQGAGGVKALGTEDARAKAYQMANAGTAPENSFQYTTETPMEFQGTGPFSSDLPLFTYRGTKQQYA